MIVDAKEACQLGSLEQERGVHADQKRHPPAAAEEVTKISTKWHGQKHVEIRFVGCTSLERWPPGAAISP